MHRLRMVPSLPLFPDDPLTAGVMTLRLIEKAKNRDSFRQPGSIIRCAGSRELNRKKRVPIGITTLSLVGSRYKSRYLSGLSCPGNSRYSGKRHLSLGTRTRGKLPLSGAAATRVEVAPAGREWDSKDECPNAGLGGSPQVPLHQKETSWQHGRSRDDSTLLVYFRGLIMLQP